MVERQRRCGGDFAWFGRSAEKIDLVERPRSDCFRMGEGRYAPKIERSHAMPSERLQAACFSLKRLRKGQRINDGAEPQIDTVLAPGCKFTERFPHASKVGNSLVDLLDFVHGQVLRITTATSLLEAEQASSFLQREAQGLGTFDELHATHNAVVIFALAAQRKLRLVHQSPALVIPNGVDVDACGFGCPANGHVVHGYPHKKVLDSGLWSGLYINTIDSCWRKDGRMDSRTKTSFIGATLAAIGATACCAGPLVLLSLGIGGAWIGNLTALEPYRPIFILLVVAFMGLAYRRLFTAAGCEPGQVCAVPAVARRQRIIFWVVLGVVTLLASSPWLLPYLF